MKRKIFSILFALVLVVSFSLVTAVPAGAQGATWYVATDGSDAFGDGTETWVDTDTSGDWSSGDTGPWLTITYAISQASDTDTILVAPGTYDEVGATHPGLIDVNKKNLTLKSTEGAEATIVCAIRILPSSDGVTIDGFTAEGPWTNGIYVWGTANCVVTNNISRNMTQVGIALAGSNNSTVENNIVEDNRWGIRLSSNSNNCTVKNNVAENNQCGIELDTSDGCTLENNLASNNQYYGIRIVESNNNKVVNNTVTLNSNDGVKVISFIWFTPKGSRNNVLEGNDISSNGGWGISFRKLDWRAGPNENNTVQYNNIYNNTGGGLLNEGQWITYSVDAANNWWGDASGPYHADLNPEGLGNSVSDNVLFAPWLKAPYRPTTPMSSFIIDHAKIDFKKKVDDDKVRVQGKFELDLVSGDGVNISEDVIVTVGPLSETITMEEMGKKGEKWQYQRSKGGEGNIKHMTINWKNGKFDIRMDKADLTGVTNPVTVSIQIGDDVGEETITMRVKKHHWDYKAK